MNLFKKSKKREKGFNDFSKLNDTIKPESYAPNQNLQPRDYLLSQGFVDFESNFEKWCMDFLEKAKADPYNGSYMDAVIQKKVGEALVYLSLQRGEHIDAITNLLEKIHVGDRVKCEAKIEHAVREQKELNIEMDMLKKIYYHKTCYSQYYELNEIQEV